MKLPQYRPVLIRSHDVIANAVNHNHGRHLYLDGRVHPSHERIWGRQVRKVGDLIDAVVDHDLTRRFPFTANQIQRILSGGKYNPHYPDDIVIANSHLELLLKGSSSETNVVGLNMMDLLTRHMGRNYYGDTRLKLDGYDLLEPELFMVRDRWPGLMAGFSAAIFLQLESGVLDYTNLQENAWRFGRSLLKFHIKRGMIVDGIYSSLNLGADEVSSIKKTKEGKYIVAAIVDGLHYYYIGEPGNMSRFGRIHRKFNRGKDNISSIDTDLGRILYKKDKKMKVTEMRFQVTGYKSSKLPNLSDFETAEVVEDLEVTQELLDSL